MPAAGSFGRWLLGRKPRFWAIAGSGAALLATIATPLLSTPNTAFAVLNRSDNCQAVADLQQELLDRGYEVGPRDGIFGSQTESAVRQFQRDREELAATGRGSEATLTALGLSRDLACAPGNLNPSNRAFQVYEVNTRSGGSLNLRSQPGGGVIGLLSDRTRVLVVETQGGWSRVRTGGWVASSYLRYLGEADDNGFRPVPLQPGSSAGSGGGSNGSSNSSNGSNGLYIPPATVGGNVIPDTTSSNSGGGGGGRSCPHTGNVEASQLNIRDRPAGTVVGSVGQGQAICLTGESEAAGRRFWAELTSDNWVAAEFIRLLN